MTSTDFIQQIREAKTDIQQQKGIEL